MIKALDKRLKELKATIPYSMIFLTTAESKQE